MTVTVEEEEGATEKSCPVPKSVTGTGLPERLFEMLRVAACVPLPAGVKVTLIEQLAPAGTLPTQLSVSAKSEASVPLNAMPVVLSAVDWLFVNVTVWGVPVVPTIWPVNVKLAGTTTTSSYSSAVANTELDLGSKPPATRTVAEFSNVAVCWVRAEFKPPVVVKVPVPGSYNSAVVAVVEPLVLMPAISTIPLLSRVAVWSARGSFIAPVGVKVAVVELYNSAVAEPEPELAPPAISTMPLFNNVAE